MNTSVGMFCKVPRVPCGKSSFAKKMFWATFAKINT